MTRPRLLYFKCLRHVIPPFVLFLIIAGALSTIHLIAENNVAGQSRIPEREAAVQDRAKKIRQVSGEIVPNQYIVVLKDDNLRSSDIRSLTNEA